MAIGLVGRKRGMTRVFTEAGVSIPVTVIEVLPNQVTQLKLKEKDGYNAIQVTTGVRRASRVTKPMLGHYTKAKVTPGYGLWEFRVETDDAADVANLPSIGSEIKVDLFKEGQLVDVSGVSKGKGFQGTIKLHNFTMGDATHGNSLSHRAPGSIGQRQSPGRVFKGKKMAAHMGNKNCTVQSQTVVRVDVEYNLLLIKGAVPGAIGGDVIIIPAVKSKTEE